ncbi:MAG: gliding motility-associated C-terminal domain-containing protein, partial [Spirochaetes bacterium]|nr:gliding motility-associated C-terminal domain-containing protein [Spirochaetota bacterium]
MKESIKRNYYLFLIIILLEIPLYADSLSIGIYDRSNHLEDTNIRFGSISQVTMMAAPQYLKVTYSLDDPADWVIQLYTDNSNSTCIGGRHGGLIGQTFTSNRIPLLWQVYSNTNTGVSLTSGNSNQWGKVKDRNDIDWATTLESRVLATNNFLGSYPVPGRQTISTDLFIYIGADFNISRDDIFSTKLNFDLLPYSSYVIPPGITHEPFTEINIIGDKMIVYADIADDDIIKTASLYYKKKNDVTFKDISYSPNSAVYRLKAEVDPPVITEEGIIYYIRAVDEQNNIMDTAQCDVKVVPYKIKTIGPAGGDIKLSDGNPEDGNTCLDIPGGALSGNHSLTFRQIYNSDEIIAGNGMVSGQMPLNVFQITPAIDLNSLSKLNLLYFDLDNNGKVETVDGLETEIDEKDLALFWWDGFEWRYMGGQVDPVNNIVSVYITRFTTFGIFSVENLSANDFRPKEKICTPNGDGINDLVIFGGSPGSFEISLFDVTGREIRKIKERPVWDGKDSRGRVVESGAYIYQFKVRING